MPKYNPRLKAMILEIVENQLHDDNPPETQETLERLMNAGHSRQEAVELIGSVVVEEIWSALKLNKPYNQMRYVAGLNKLK
jgi:hypothetical protein